MLYAIGEKNYFSGKKDWPPEVSLVCTILFQGVIFVVGKLLMKATGSDIFNMVKQNISGSSKPSQAPSSNKPSAQKGKMKEPTIDLDQLLNKKTS